MRIFSVLPRPVSPLVNPSRGVPTATQKPTERPKCRRNTPTRPQHKNAVQRPTERRTAYTNTTAPTRPKPNHRTEPGRLFKITLYSNPDEVATHRVAPTETHRQPHREPERRRGVMGQPHRQKPPTAAHRRHRGQQKTPRAEARSVAPYLFIFNRSERTTSGKIKKQSKIIFSPPY